MKKVLRSAVAVVALAAACAANAVPVLDVSGGSFATVSGNDFAWITGPVRSGGALSLSEAATVQVEYLGREAGFANTLFRWGALAGGTEVFSTGSGGGVVGQTSALPGTPAAVGAAVSFAAGAGELLFNFLVSATGATVGNGDDPSNGDGIAFWSAPSNVVYLLLDDGGAGGDADYDDMVIRVTVASARDQVVATPEPQTLVLILAGLVMMGLITRRRLRG